ncbi:MAG: hypothetical protein VYB40_06640 [Candidatus Thermoplasmatota archaeon]|nr:hypothetical protein [Candidatus Thermoplasmatota archaeon]
MSEEQDRLLSEGDGFLTSQVSFDIDEPRKPVRRKQRKVSESESPNEEGPVTGCPGCGNDIPEGEFVEAMLSFVTGTNDYLSGDAVRIRSVQISQQLISQGRLPDPHSEWSNEIVQRLEQHIENLANERARLLKRQAEGLDEGIGPLTNIEEIREGLRAEIEQEIVGEVAVAIRDQIRQQVIAEMVPQIRAEVEKELWDEFEDALRKERAKNQ